MKTFLKGLQHWFLLLVFLVALIVRLIGIDTVPSTPYWEEVALGYDAYSLLQTGRDHHGAAWPITAFQSFGDYKPTMYFYATAVSVAIFGLNTLAVRVPAALFSALSVTLLTWLVQRWAGRKVAIWTALLATLQPWSWHVGRLGFEVNLSVTLLLAGLVAAEISLSPNTLHRRWERWLWPAISAFTFVGAMYAYHAARLLGPLMAAVTVLTRETWWPPAKISKVLPRWAVAAIVAIMVAAPLLLSLRSPVIQQRFKETSTLASNQFAQEANAAREKVGNTLPSRLFLNTKFFLLRDIEQRYLSHMSPSFLFLRGDVNPRHSSQYLGLLYPWELLTVLAGLAWSGRYLSKRIRFQLVLLTLIVPVASSLTFATPHALRALPLASFLSIWSALGVVALSDELSKKLPRLRSFVHLGWFALLLGSFAVLAFFMATQYTARTALEWQKGYKEIIQALRQHQQPGETLHLSRAYGRPAMYVWFYEKTDPRLVQSVDVATPKDQGEFLAFQEWTFFDGQWLGDGLAAAPLEIVPRGREIIETISIGNGERTWAIYR